jgi:hypothetical protein
MHHDEIVRDDWLLRYVCNCGYRSAATNRLRRAELTRSIHRHRHRMGTAGTYPHTTERQHHDNDDP